MDTADLTHADSELLEGKEGEPACECVHDGDGTLCPAAAEVRVIVVCSDPGCDNAVGVYLLCRECLDVWEEQWVRTGELRLRVLPL